MNSEVEKAIETIKSCIVELEGTVDAQQYNIAQLQQDGKLIGKTKLVLWRDVHLDDVNAAGMSGYVVQLMWWAGTTLTLLRVPEDMDTSQFEKWSS